MPTFKDTKEREWTLLLDPLLCEQIREECDKDFLKGEPGDTLQRIDDDPVLHCNVLWILCREQCKQRGVEQKEFYLGVIGDAIDAAGPALLDAIVSFIPRRHRELLVVGAAKNAKLRELALEQGLAIMNDPNLEAQVKAAIDAKVAEILTPLRNAGNTQDSSVFTPKG